MDRTRLLVCRRGRGGRPSCRDSKAVSHLPTSAVPGMTRMLRTAQRSHPEGAIPDLLGLASARARSRRPKAVSRSAMLQGQPGGGAQVASYESSQPSALFTYTNIDWGRNGVVWIWLTRRVDHRDASISRIGGVIQSYQQSILSCRKIIRQ